MNTINIILPRRERVGALSSGAVALVVKELYEKSSLREKTTIWSGPQKENKHLLPLEIIPDSSNFLFSENRRYANYISKRIIDSPNVYIEIHNRAKIFLLLKRHLKKNRFTLYLHNDPFDMGGLETPAKRQKVLKLVDGVICVSHFVRDRFLDGISNNKEKCFVIHNSLDMSLYNRPAPADNNIIFVGRMIKEKGALELAYALVDILPQNKDWSATFIGGRNISEDYSLSSYERKIRSVLKPIENQINWTGFLPNDSVQRILRKSKIAVIPSKWMEAQSRFLVEAMANGCAVISSGRGGIYETIGDCGLVVDPEKPSDIYWAINTYINNPELLEIKRKKGFERALKLFDVRDKIEELDAFRKNITQG